MPEQETSGSGEQKFHPAVEEVMETSGPDIGRIKDIDTAHVVAENEKDIREKRPFTSTEEIKEEVNKHTQLEVMKKAAASQDLAPARAALSAQRYGDNFNQPEEYIFVSDNEKKAMAAEALAAGKSYDQLQEEAKPVSQAEQAKAKSKLRI